MGLLVEWTQLRKESLSLRTSQIEASKLEKQRKQRLKKKKKDRTEYQGLKDNYKSVIYL